MARRSSQTEPLFLVSRRRGCYTKTGRRPFRPLARAGNVGGRLRTRRNWPEKKRMRCKIRSAAIAACCLLLGIDFAAAQGTAFTYQGRLNAQGSPADGAYDLRFGLYDAASSGAQQGPILTNSAVAVSNGLFTVTLDFGAVF